MPMPGGSKGKKKRSLFSITMGPHSDDDLAEMIEETARGSDRTAAILSASYVHYELNHNILWRLELYDNATDKFELLLGRDGPLSSLYASTILGYAMNILDANTMEDINVIRRVRNAFAHAPQSISFQDDLIAAECRRLKTSTSKYGRNLDARSRYVLTAYVIALTLLHDRTENFQKRVRNLKRRALAHEKKWEMLQAFVEAHSPAHQKQD